MKQTVGILVLLVVILLVGIGIYAWVRTEPEGTGAERGELHSPEGAWLDPGTEWRVQRSAVSDPAA